MSSPYGWGVTPKQPNQVKQVKQPSGYSKESQEQGQGGPAPQSGFGGHNQQQGRGSSQGKPTTKYGFGGQSQQGRGSSQEQPAQQYGFGGHTEGQGYSNQPQYQSQEQPAQQYGFGSRNQGQYQPQGQPTQQYDFAQQPQQGAPQNDMPYGFNGGQKSMSQPSRQYQQGISAQSPQQGYYPPMQEQFDNNDKYNTKAVLGFIFTFLFWPAGLVLSILGCNEIKKNGGKGKGFTTASFVLCGISIVSTFVVIIMFSMGLMNFGAGHPTLKNGQAGGYSTSKSTPGWEFSDGGSSSSKGSTAGGSISKDNASNPVTAGKDKDKYATVKDWYEKSNDAKTNIHMLGATYAPNGEETTFEGTNTLVEKLTINGLTADQVSGNFGESVKTDYGNIAAVMKEQVSGSAKLHLIVQNENGEVFIDQTY